MNKIFSFIMICLYLLGTIGGIGYAFYNKAYVIVIGVAALAYMDYPKVRDYFNSLTD